MLSSIPDYWHTLAAPVAPGKGIPHFRDVAFEYIQGTGLGTAISMSGSADVPLEHFTLKDIKLEAQHAGAIRYAQGLKLDNVSIESRDGTPLAMKDTQQLG